jgi:hypothetical protein
VSRKFKVPVGLVALASDPASGSTGDIYYNTTYGIMVHNGTTWVSINFPLDVDGGVFDSVAQYQGGSSPTETATQTLDGGTP